MNKNYLDVIYLIRLALGEEINEDKFNDSNWEEIYRISEEQNISNLTFYGIEKLNNKIDEYLYDRWLQDREEYIINDIKQQEEGKLIIRKLNENNIDHAISKGYLIKDIYPTTDMRTMGDIDFLIKPKDRKKVKDIMESLGFDTAKFNKNNEDIYTKKPIYEVEIHTQLLEKNSIYYQYYKNIWDKLILKDKNTYIFSLEDFYIFMIVHFAKHYLYAGAGIRNIIDIYLYNKKYDNDLNKQYIKNELKELELEEFEQDILNLIDSIFNDNRINKKTEEMINTIFTSGIYGNNEQIISLGLKEYKSRKNYLFHRIFPTVKIMKKKFPILNKIIILLPFCWLYRLIEEVIKRPKNIKREINRIRFVGKK